MPPGLLSQLWEGQLQECSNIGPWLLLFCAPALCPSCLLCTAGDGAPLPPLHLECLLTQAALWRNAHFSHCTHLCLLYLHGSEPSIQSTLTHLSQVRFGLCNPATVKLNSRCRYNVDTSADTVKQTQTRQTGPKQLVKDKQSSPQRGNCPVKQANGWTETAGRTYMVTRATTQTGRKKAI